MLRGIYPILITPFDTNGQIDGDSLRRVVRFELEGGIDGLGVGGFASEAYKLSDAERMRCAEIVADEVNGRVSLIIGIAPGSVEVAIEQARYYAALNPAALMTLPPSVMQYEEAALVDFYVALGEVSSAPIMVQQSPHYPGFAAGKLPVESMAEISRRCSNVRYFKIEGPGSAERIKALSTMVDTQNVALFGGVGGIALQEELRAGASGLLPGVGFNEFFVDVWKAWQSGDYQKADKLLRTAQPLVEAVSGRGHEFSIHARKHLLKRAGIIDYAAVRRPSVKITDTDMTALDAVADGLGLRLLS